MPHAVSNPDSSRIRAHSPARSRLDQLLAEAKCIQCSYPLRGLPGDIVTCPECGQVCDKAKFILREGLGPWYKAPGLHMMIWPMAWFVIAAIICWFAFTLYFIRTVPLMMFYCTCIFSLVIWIILFMRANAMLDGVQGIVFALLYHAILIGYLAGVIAIFAGLFAASSAGPLRMPWQMAVAPFAGALLLWLGHRTEKFIAERCIRKHLSLSAAAAAQHSAHSK